MSTRPSFAPAFEALASQLEGELLWDDAMRAIYATDASVYRALPLAVCVPKSTEDARALIAFAARHACSLIPRAAGTSLAGQVVGEGIVVDISKYWTNILQLNVDEKWVRVQPGVVRDELNQFLKPHGLMFAPETSTSNRCMIGGMAGNNSCGTHSLVYGTTRDHVLAIEALLSDGSTIIAAALPDAELSKKCELPTLEGALYRGLRDILSEPGNAAEIRQQFPHPDIHRRNTGYALDLLLPPLGQEGLNFNLKDLLCGSEGTLAFFTELKLQLVPLPPPHQAVLAVHLQSIPEAARATLIARRFEPRAIELIDKVILDCAKTNAEQAANRSFVHGDPGALLVIEFAAASRAELDERLSQLEAALRADRLGTHFPIVRDAAIERVWALRNAGLGVLTNVPGDRKPIAGIEDTAIRPADLPSYVDEFLEIMNSRGVESVAYAHIGDGEIHFRPMLDLKLGTDRKLYREIAEEVAALAKRYGASLSGEHGDGRARGEFIRLMIGNRNYELCRRIKTLFDPGNLFNPGKIVDAPPIDTDLRYEPDAQTPRFETVFDFSATKGILRMAEKCNGTGACRKTEKIGGVMCPSYMATRDEKDTTRARANILRECLTRSPRSNPFDHDEIGEVMELCLSCKGCKSECPSNVDVARLKAEFQHQYHKSNGIPFTSRLVGNVARLYRIASVSPSVSNALMQLPWLSDMAKRSLGVAPGRSLPRFSSQTLRSWSKRNLPRLNPPASRAKRSVYLFCDEYSNHTDAHVGQAAIELLTALGYRVEIPEHSESGRAFFSKGMLTQAKRIANRNVSQLADLITAETPLIGIEPSAILGFRDEYPDIVDSELKSQATTLAANCLLIDEFLANEIAAGRIRSDAFTSKPRRILFHGHCHQKALSSQANSLALLSLPTRYKAELIPSGCCGMAGSFGYEAEKFQLSQQIGELVLYPAIRRAQPDTLIAATGTSCRHQIKDGLQREARHPVEILRDALRER